MTVPDLVVRARRAWVGGAWQPAQVAVTDGRITALDGPVPAGATVVDARRRRGPPARPRRQPRARQRAGPHRVGGLRVGHPRRGGRWRHDPRRHAAQLDPAHHDGRGAGREARGDRRQADRGRGVLGRGRAGEPRVARPLHDAGVRGFKAFLTPSGVDEFGHLDPAQLEAALAEVATLGSVLVVHAEDPADLRGDGALGDAVRRLPGQPAGRERAARDRPGDRRDAAHRRPRARPAPVRRRLARPGPRPPRPRASR